MLNNRQDVRARGARLKRPIIIDLSKIGIIEKYLKKPTDDQLSFDEKEANPHPYLGVLIISVPVAGVIIPKLLVDTKSASDILFTNTFEWMGIHTNFLRPYSNMVFRLSGVLTTAKG